MWKRKNSFIEFSDGLREVRIDNRVLRILREYEQKDREPESGGILLGIVCNNHDSIIKITKPNELDTRGFSFFNRARKPAQLQINKSWNNSRGCLIYLGEWHTHSEINPKPSVIDKKMIEKTFKETKMEINYLYLVIIGNKNTIWVGKKDTNGLVKLERKSDI
jgi:integrative and conjugative element protein (TIGR02256 family)